MRYWVLIFSSFFAILLTGLPASADDGVVCRALRAVASERNMFQVGPPHAGTDPLVGPQMYFSDKADLVWRAQADKKFSFSANERAELEAKSRKQVFGSYEPNCDWSIHVGRESSPRLQFSKPLVSSDGKLVFVGVDTLENRWRSGGSLCLIRKNGASWNAQCMVTWVS